MSAASSPASSPSWPAPRFWLEGGQFDRQFEDFLRARAQRSENLREAVAALLAELRAGGDEALIAAAKKYDGVRLKKEDLQLPTAARREAAAACPADIRQALELAAKRIAAFHEKQMPQDAAFTDAAGVRQGWRWRAVDSAGLYIPGGTASYPSSLLMNAIPAKIAGVERIAAASPPCAGGLDPVLMAAAEIAGVDEFLQAGGAFAIGALAFGTQSFAPVAVIAGPGNQWVAEAKRQIYGHAGIDMIAGPSEILVIAARNNPPAWIAADLLSQAEHDEKAQSILMTDDAAFARAVLAEMAGLGEKLPRRAIAAASWAEQGAVMILPLGQAGAYAGRIAPEHAELAVPEPERLAQTIRHAGALFYGAYTPEAVGDYVGGPNHVLPTGGAARFSSGLAVSNFMLRSSFLDCPREGLRQIGPAAAKLAEAEGFGAHALAISLRLGGNQPEKT